MKRFSLQNIIIRLLSWQLHMIFCNANDRLKPGEFISFNDTLVSDGGLYALGFFSPTNSTTNLYVGIWFYGLPQRTVVWVANRENPVKDPAARFQISNDTNLVIVNSKRTVLWSSNLRGFGLPGEDTQALLHHNGNLILKQGSNTTLWQSFDYATDTLVPDMKLGINYKKHTANHLISWRSEIDPSPGNFTFGVDPKTNLQLFIWHGLEPYWRSGPLSDNFYLQVKVRNISAVYYQFTRNSDEVYLLVTVSDDSIRVRVTLDSFGNIKILVWNDSKQEWVNTRTQQQHKCDRYASCNPFGYCDRVGNASSCKCLEGFEPKVQSDWNYTNYKGGCVRKKQLQCGYANSFLRMTNMKLPDKFIYVENRSSDCEAECRRNCSCTAYAYNNSTLSGALDQFCLVWMGELIDSETAISLVPGQDLYLRIADSNTGTSSRKGKTGIAAIIFPVAAAIISFICVFLVWMLGKRIRGLFRKQNKDRLQDPCPNIDFRNGSSDEHGESDPKQTPELQVLDFETVSFSTDNFSDSQAIGQGGFGKVYKGKLPNGQNIAVKRLTRDSGQGVDEFKNEVTLIAKLQHRNLVRLLGCCIQGEERLLVYEYMPNKSLDFFLFDPAQKAVLDWGKRFNIIKGISRALLYLHQDSRLKIIHRDLKASNILLDEDMTAKVSDFGLARIVARNQEQTNTNRVVGTYGYMSPEYAMEGLFSVKSDVYSFGVLVLEILSGLKNIGFHLVMNFPNLLSYAWKLWCENKAAEFVDTSIRETCSLHEAMKCMYVGLLCVQDLPEDRPTMSRIVFMLENDVKINAELRQPVFTARRNLGLEGVDPAYYDQEVHCTTNYLTNTMVEGR